MATRRPRRTLRQLRREVVLNFGDCSAWLERMWPEWSWVVDFWRTTRDLRRTAP